MTLLAGPISKAAGKGIFFFLNPESPFPSGQANLLDLEKYSLKEHQRLQFLGERSGIKFWISPEEINRDIDVSFRTLDVRTKSIYWILEIDHGIAKTYNEQSGLQEKVDLDSLTPLADDLGVALPLAPVFLRSEPSWKSASTIQMGPGDRLRILQIESDWLLVSPLKQPEAKGWVELSGVVTRFDFASHALPNGGRWLEVSHRDGNALVVPDGQRIPLASVKALITRTEIGLAQRPLRNLGIPQRGSIDLIMPKSREWIESTLPGHGRVFWKRSKEDIQYSENERPVLLSTESLLKRSITSVAFHPKEPQFGLASAEGIFLTRDGFIWEQIQQFEKKDYPVAISETGQLFVGPYRSSSEGTSFQPYLKWDSISKMDQHWSSLKHHPVLRLIQIEPINKDEIRLVMNNGLRTWRMKGNAKYGTVQNWSLE